MTVMRTTTGFISVNNARLYHEIAGDGFPLVLIHAGISDHRMWDDQIAIFAKRYKVVRYDVRGFGRSAMPEGESFSVIEDQRLLLDALGIERACAMGVSMGGGIALNFAIAHPEMVAALVLVASGLPGAPASETVLQRRALINTAVEAGDRLKLLDLMVDLWADGVEHRAPPSVRERVREMFRDNMSLLFLKNVPQQDSPWKAIDRLAEIRAPTLIIVGDRDQPDLLENAELLASGIAGARKVVIPGAAHMVNMERPQEFNRIVLDFLTTALDGHD